MAGEPPPLSESASAAIWVQRQVDGWREKPPVNNDLNETLRRLGRWRSRLLANTFVSHHGPKVLHGPFAGMRYVTTATEGALIPRLLGSYESELHPYLQQFSADGLDCVIDVGCAEGYYAVGLARLMPHASVHAYDIDPAAQAACRELAALNDVADRVEVRGEMAPDGFQAFAGRRALVVVDAEGAEDNILQPDLSPALAGMRLIVETHDLYNRGVMARLVERFTATHDITVVHEGLKSLDLPPWLRELGQLDQLLAVWEWRQRPTPWLVMVPKAA